MGTLDLKLVLLLLIASAWTTDAAISDLQPETTRSFHTLKFTWFDLSCTVTRYELNCTGGGHDVDISEFSAVLNDTSGRCEYYQYGFQSFTTYTCSLASVGVFGLPSSTTVQTLTNRNPTEPQNVLITNITASSFVVSWGPPAFLNDFREYNIRLVGTIIQHTTGSNWHEVRGLEAGTTYTVEVGTVASTLTSNIDYAPNVLAKTLLLVPDAVTSFSYTARAPDLLEVSWSADTTADRLPQGFNISYEPLYNIQGAVNPGANRVEMSVDGGNVRSFTLQGLQSQFGYRVEIAAYNSAGTSASTNVDAPPFIPVPSTEAKDSRKRNLQFQFSGVGNCTYWRTQYEAADIVIELLNRLSLICPECDYTRWATHFFDIDTVCSPASPDHVIFVAEGAFCVGTLQSSCPLARHLELFISLPNPFLVVSNSLLVANSNCPLYTDSYPSLECVSGSSSIAGGVVGGFIGGLVLGVVIAMCVLIPVYVYIKRRGDEKEEITPHPKTRRYLVREEAGGVHPKTTVTGTTATTTTTTTTGHRSQYNQNDDPGYEYLPVFKSEGKAAAEMDDSDIDYDIPQDVLSGLPTPTSPHPLPEYECIDPPPQPPSKSQKKGKKGPRKPTYINMKKDGKGKATKPPTVMAGPGGGSKFESPWNEVTAPSKAQPSKKAPPPPTLKGPKVQAGVGVALAETPQAIARKEGEEEEEEEGGFEAMRARLANKKGAKVNEGQSSTAKKMPLVPKTSSSSLQGSKILPIPPPAPKPPGLGQGAGGHGQMDAVADVIPPVLPKPKKKKGVTMQPNQAYNKNKHQDFPSRAAGNTYQMN